MRRSITKFIFAAMAFACAFAPANSFAQKGEKSVGLRGGFTTRNTTATAGLYFSYRFSEHFRLSPKADYAFRHNGVDGFSFNIDCETPIALGAPENKVNFYTIIGLNYSNITSRTATVELTSEDPAVNDDSSQRTNRFGLNIGVGLEYFATPTLRLAFEPKCQLIKNFTGGWFNISIGYVF